MFLCTWVGVANSPVGHSSLHFYVINVQAIFIVVESITRSKRQSTSWSPAPASYRVWSPSQVPKLPSPFSHKASESCLLCVSATAQPTLTSYSLTFIPMLWQVRRHLERIGFLLPSCEFQGLNSGHQACNQVSLIHWAISPAHEFHPNRYYFTFFSNHPYMYLPSRRMCVCETNLLW